MSDSVSPSTSYTIRPFESRDRDGILSLYETVFGRERSVDWFRWKFADNPYVDHVPIIVAETDGEIVGCRAFFAQELRIDGTERLAFQPCDTMVHPDHRKRGLFSRMNEYAIERYVDGTPACCFNFPNENSRRGNRKHGWQEIGRFPVYYRPQDPVGSVRELADGGGSDTSSGDDSDAGDDAPSDGRGDDGEGRDTDSSPATADRGGQSANGTTVVHATRQVPDTDPDTETGAHTDATDTQSADAHAPSDDSSADGVANALADVIASSQQAGDRLVTQSSPELAVVRFETPPAELLAETYRRSIPDGIHTNRTAEFYRWRFENPTRSYTAYVATRDGETPVAALVRSRVDDHLRIVETLPRDVDNEQEAINQLLVTALGDCPNRNYVTAFGETLPTPIRFRFYPDTRFPLSTLIQPTARTLLARDLGADLGLEETGDADWTLSRLDLDTT